jgi:hypothetical protein
MMGRQNNDQASLFYAFRLDDRVPKEVAGMLHGGVPSSSHHDSITGGRKGRRSKRSSGWLRGLRLRSQAAARSR